MLEGGKVTVSKQLTEATPWLGAGENTPHSPQLQTASPFPSPMQGNEGFSLPFLAHTHKHTHTLLTTWALFRTRTHVRYTAHARNCTAENSRRGHVRTLLYTTCTVCFRGQFSLLEKACLMSNGKKCLSLRPIPASIQRVAVYETRTVSEEKEDTQYHDPSKSRLA